MSASKRKGIGSARPGLGPWALVAGLMLPGLAGAQEADPSAEESAVPATPATAAPAAGQQKKAALKKKADQASTAPTPAEPSAPAGVEGEEGAGQAAPSAPAVKEATMEKAGSGASAAPAPPVSGGEVGEAEGASSAKEDAAPKDIAPAPQKKPAAKVMRPPVMVVPAFVERRDRGVHYFRNGRASLALTELEAAKLMKGGEDDFLIHLFLARVYHDQNRIEDAYISIHRAITAAVSAENKKRSGDFKAGLDNFYGEVTFVSAGPEAGPRQGFLILEPSQPMIRPAKKLAFRRVREQHLQRSVTLPRAVYLPSGVFLANGLEFAVKQGETTEVAVGLVETPEGAFPWGYVIGGAAGVVAVLAVGAAAYLLLPEEPPPPVVTFEGGEAF